MLLEAFRVSTRHRRSESRSPVRTGSRLLFHPACVPDHPNTPSTGRELPRRASAYDGRSTEQDMSGRGGALCPSGAPPLRQRRRCTYVYKKAGRLFCFLCICILGCHRPLTLAQDGLLLCEADAPRCRRPVQLPGRLVQCVPSAQQQRQLRDQPIPALSRECKG